jgi:C1A family cysteine protease
MKFGYINSGYDERDLILDDNIAELAKSMDLPTEYDFTEYLNINCKDQGGDPVCVPYSIALSLETRKTLEGIRDFWIDTNDIFSHGGTDEGMMIRDALSYMKKTGYKTKDSNSREKISYYGKLNSHYAIRQSVYINGPCIMGLPVHNLDKDDFWNGDEFYGGHAIACVGWDKEGLILMNSWGNEFGYEGKCTLPYEDCSSTILECWTFI